MGACYIFLIPHLWLVFHQRYKFHLYCSVPHFPRQGLLLFGHPTQQMFEVIKTVHNVYLVNL